MPNRILILLLLFSSSPLCSVALSQEVAKKASFTLAGFHEQAIPRNESTWKRVADQEPDARFSVRTLSSYALLLAEANRHCDRIDRLLILLEQKQDRDVASPAYGNFRWYFGDAKVTDRNAVEFVCSHLVPLWQKYRERLTPNAKNRLEVILRRAARGCVLHNVQASYTNIALLNAANLILLGENFADSEALKEGKARLTAFVLFTARNGIAEYVSPTYYGVDLDALMMLDKYATDATARRQAEALYQLFWSDLAANWFLPADRLSGTCSRSYSYLTGKSHCLHRHLWHHNWSPPQYLRSIEWSDALPGSWRPAKELFRRCQEEYPRTVEQRWGYSAMQWRKTQIYPDIALGTVGAGYGQQDATLTVDLPGKLTSDSRCYFIPDAREDPYGVRRYATGSAAHPKALHLQPFWAASQNKNDALTLVLYDKKTLLAKNVPQDGFINLQSHFVLRKPETLLVNGKQVSLQPKKPLELDRNAPVVLRYGTALLGVRVLWATTKEGKPARIQLLDDGNSHGVIRLTIKHQREGSKSNVLPKEGACGAAMHLRIASEQQPTVEAARKFYEAMKKEVPLCQVVPQKRFDLKLAAANKNRETLSLSLELPSRKVTCVPCVEPTVLLRVNGEERGRPLLAKLPTLAELKKLETQAKSITVAGTTHWEAEEGVLFPRLVTTQKDAAGEPPAGGKAVQMLDQVYWELDVQEPGKYYLWARVLAPDGTQDSLNIASENIPLPQQPPLAWHLTRGKNWHWTRFKVHGNSKPHAFQLATGRAKLIFFPRESGVVVDRVLLTKKLDFSPQ